MDMASMTMGSATSTASAAMSSMTDMSSMDMGGSCKISMLWNWDVIDACFISTSWQIKSHGMFAGSCIGVILLVMSLEALRRLSKEYDRYILRRFKRQVALDASYARTPIITTNTENDSTAKTVAQPQTKTVYTPPLRFRPSLVQQSIRALLHMVTFAVAYFVMLLAMYYNGYFIICIFIGAYLGGFVFSWESIAISAEPNSMATAATEEVTVCCG